VHDLALALHPAPLAARAGMIPAPWQAAVLRSDAQRLLHNCSRKSGQCTTAATFVTHAAIYGPGGLLLLSPALRQSQEFFRTCLDVYRAVDHPAAYRLRLDRADAGQVLAMPEARSARRRAPICAPRDAEAAALPSVQRVDAAPAHVGRGGGPRRRRSGRHSLPGVGSHRGPALH
jgi:hypothetical protein